MKKLQLAFSALAAITGIGGAYASYAPAHNAFAATHNWVTKGGKAVTSLNHTTTLTASGRCVTGVITTCLKAVSGGAATILGTFQ